MEAVVADPVNPPIAVSIPSSTNREKFDLWEQYFWSRMGITAVDRAIFPTLACSSWAGSSTGWCLGCTPVDQS